VKRLKKCIELIFRFLILLKLIMNFNPLLSLFINFILLFFLVFNMFSFIAYLVSLILILSRLSLLLTERSVNEIQRKFYILKLNRNLRLPYMQIRPTWKNATIITLWICYLVY